MSLLFLCLLIFACGYRFSGGGALPGGVTDVALGAFDNRSGETGVDGIIGNDIIYEFARNGKRLSYRSQSPDATLSGTVMSVTTKSVSRKNVHSVSERQVTVSVSLKLVDLSGVVIWEVSGISESEEYEVGSDKSTTEMNKRDAITQLSSRLAEKIYYQMTDDF